MTLGEMIETFEAMLTDMEVDGFCRPHGYRGCYTELAFKKRARKIMAKEALRICCECLNKGFMSYKGDGYLMAESTPVWMVPYYGGLGQRICKIDKGKIILGETNSPVKV